MQRWDSFRNLRPLFPLLKVSFFGLGLALVLSLSLGGFFDGLTGEPPHYSPPQLKGMALGLFSQEASYNYQKELQEIRSLGTNAILLMVPWYQENIRSNKMEARYQWNRGNITLSDDKLVEVIQKSRQMGLKVLLMPYLRFDQRGPKEWRGVLAPQDFNTWAKHYTDFILHYAKIAGQEKVDFFSVGSELGSMEDKKDFWQGLIPKVRQSYQGSLLYSANWDHYTHPVFWQDLDAIGITSYNRLTNEEDPSLRKLKKSWKKLKKEILQFQTKYPDKKIIITEVGYPSLNGANKDPWNYFVEQPVDLKEQALCYQAFIETWNGTEVLEGVFWWVWFGDGGPQDKSYTPRGKPAAAWIQRWYGGTPGVSI